MTNDANLVLLDLSSWIHYDQILKVNIVYKNVLGLLNW